MKSLRLLTTAIVAGLLVGLATSFGQTAHHARWLDPLVNSASAWLVAPFLVGMLAPRRKAALVVGLITCLAQLAGYTIVSELRGFAATGGLLVFWTGCGVIGGPIFGLGGYALRREHGAPHALGAVLLPSAFLVEGLWVYGARLGYWSSAALWIGIAAVLALVLARDVRIARWFALTLPLALAGELAISAIYSQSF